MWQTVKPYIIGALVLAVVFGAGCWVGFRKATNDHGDTTNQLRSELGRASDANRSLKADNDRLRAANTQLGKELDGAIAEATESQRIAAELGGYNRETERNLDAAGKVVDRLRAISREVREGNSQAKTKQ